MTVPGADGSDQLAHGSGDMTLLIHMGREHEDEFAMDENR